MKKIAINTVAVTLGIVALILAITLLSALS
jgi:hypothetical protein